MKATRYSIMACEIIVALLVLLFLYTAISKLQNRDSFLVVISQSPLIASFAEALSWLVPFGELAITILLFIPSTRVVGLIASFILLICFSIYVGYMLSFATKLPCRCGGVIQDMSWHQHLWFNIFFTIASFIAFVLYPKRFVATNRSSRKPVNRVGIN